MSRRLSIDALLRIRYPTESVPPRLSPDAWSLALTVTPAVTDHQLGTSGDFDARNVPVTVIGSQLTVIDIPSGSQWLPFPDAEISWGGQWSPDGSMLAAYVAMGGPACLGILHLADRRVQLVDAAAVRPYLGFELPVWTLDSRSVVLKLQSASEAMPVGADATDRSSSHIVVFSHRPDSQAADQAQLQFVTNRFGCDFGMVNVETTEVRRLAENWIIAGTGRLAPDGSAVAVPVIVEREQTLQQSISDLMVVPLNGAEPRAVARRVVFDLGQSFSWSPDSSRIAFTTSDQPSATGTRPPGRLFIAEANGQKQPLDLSVGISDDLRQSYEQPRWSATGDEVFCLVADGMWCVPTDGSAAQKIPIASGKVLTSWIQPPDHQVLLTTAEGALPLLVRDSVSQSLESVSLNLNDGGVTTHSVLRKRYVAGGGTLGMEVDWDRQMAYLQLEAAQHPAEVWQLDLTTGEATRHGSLSPRGNYRQLGTKRLMEYLDSDGARRRASLLLPPDYVEGRPVPMVTVVYGGDIGSERVHGFGLFPSLCRADAYLFASRGFAVLQPDIPLGPSDPRRGIARSVLPAVNKVVELGIVDSARIGVLGQSYGGYSVLALITQSKMFAAAVCSAADVNLTSSYGDINDAGDSMRLGWCESGQARLGGSLWESRDAYIENSSLFYLDRVTTPLLLFSGDDDPGAFAQASETFSALRRLGQRVELRNYKGEGHWPGSWSEPNLRDVLHRTIAWFDEHLKA